MIFEKMDSSPEAIISRLELFIKKIKKDGVILENVPGLSKQSRSNYRMRGNIPRSANLLEWSTKFDLSVDWLLTGKGEMFDGAAESSATPSTPVSERETKVLRELAEAKAEIARLQKKMEMLLTRTVELQDELLTVHRAEKAKREKKAEQPSAEESVECAAHTGHTAARS